MIKIYNFLLNDFKNHKKRYLFISIFILLSCFVFENVSAFSVKDYDSRLALFDGFENSIPVCESDTYVNDSGTVGTNSSWHRVCYKGTVPNINTLIEYMPYVTRIEYKIKNTDEVYYVFMFDSHCDNCQVSSFPYVQSNNVLYQGQSSFFISLLPESRFITTSDGTVIALESTYSSVVSSKVFFTQSVRGPMPFYTSTFNLSAEFVFDNNNPYFDITVKTNYDLFKINSDSSSNIIVNATTEHIFETDIDITIPKDNYVLLVPKKTVEFSSYLWTDSNFAYEEMYYDTIDSTYSKINGGGLNEINFGSLGGFNWLRWDFSFTDLDLTSRKVIMLYNHGNSDLHIKLFSSDFYYRLMSSDSSEFCVGDLCYKNDYDEFKTFAYSTGSINNKFDTTDYTDGLIYIRELPNIIKDFSSCFTFIGVLFLNFFNIIDGSILNYFYIVFGITMIVLLIKILK